MSPLSEKFNSPASGVLTSLIPSDLPESSLPYGPAPVKLVEMETAVVGIGAQLRDRIRALADQANRVRYRAPMDAAVCWSEAGRLLDQRAGRTAEAWVCYSRALAIFPDHKPALGALRRLARRARSAETMSLVLESNIDRASDPEEKAALWTECAVLELKRGNNGAAMDALREAVRACPEALVPNVLKIGVAAAEQHDEDLAESLDVIADRWPKGEDSRDLPLMLALMDERLGRLDAGLKRLDKAAIEQGLSMAGQWARLRLCLRLNRPDEATSTIVEMLESIENKVMRSALKRLRLAVGELVSDAPSEGEMPDAKKEDLVWDIELLHSARSGRADRERLASRELKAKVASPALKEALAVNELLFNWKSKDQPAKLDEDIDPQGSIGRAVASFTGLKPAGGDGSEDDSEKSRSMAHRLHEAIVAEDWEEVANNLATLREKAEEERDRWALAVAESAILIHFLDRPDDALAMLRGETDRLNRAPLPALIRAYDPNHESLSELAVSEANDSSDDEFKAWRFGWAALHMEPHDRNEAGRLYLRSIELKPDLKFSLAGIGRSVSDRSVLAEAYLNAAEVARDLDERTRFLLVAGMHYLAKGSGSRAAELLGEALDLEPEDSVLRKTVARLTLTHMEAALSDYVDPDSQIEDADIDTYLTLGTLAMEIDPQAAVEWFNRALKVIPEDPIAKLGLRESLAKTRQTTPLVKELSEDLERADTAVEKARINQRLAHTYRWHEEDAAKSALALKSVEEDLPGYRPGLVQLAKHFLVTRQKDELYETFAGLLKTVTDDDDVGALAMAAWRMRQSDKEILRLALEKNPSDILALAELEGIAETGEERKELLQRLTEAREGSAIHLSRLAKALSDAGDKDRAAELHKRVLDIEGGSLFDLFELASHQREGKRNRGLVETLSALAEQMTSQEHKTEYLLEAMDIARAELNDNRLSVRLCLDVLKLSPQNAYAYIAAREILGFKGGEQVIGQLEKPRLDDSEMLMELINIRLGSAVDPGEQRQLHLELARVLLDGGDQDSRDSAKQHIEQALSLVGEDLAAHRWLAEIHGEDGEWTEAIEHLMSAARLVDKPEVGMEIFFTLGELYMDHTERDEFAEKSFLKVLSWDRSHKPSLDRISSLYIRMGNFNRASKALEHLIRLIEDPAKKVEKMVVLAGVLEENLGRSKDAEKLLLEARRVDPFAFQPVEALAEIYKRQRDPLALNIHLDGALTTLAAGLVDNPDDKEIYSNIWKVLATKGDRDLAGMAAEAMHITGVPVNDLPGNARKTRWEGGARIGDPVFNEHVCTKAVPSGLRETIKAVEEPLARMLNVSSRLYGVDRGAKLAKNNPLAAVFNDMAQGFGVTAPNVYATGESTIKIAPGSPASIMVPKQVTQTEDNEILGYVACYCLQLIRLGLCLPTMIPPDQFRRLIAGVVHLSIKDFVPQGLKVSDVEPYFQKARSAVSTKTAGQIRPFAFDCVDPVNRETLTADILGIGMRSGFIGSGSLSGALSAIRAIAGRPEAPLSSLDGVGPLMAFVFSKDHIELRARMGI